MVVAVFFFVCKQEANGEANHLVSNVQFIANVIKGVVCAEPTVQQCPEENEDNISTEICPICEEQYECEICMCAECPEIHSIPARYGNCDVWKYICGFMFCLLIALAIAILALVFTQPDSKAWEKEKDKMNKQTKMLMAEKNDMNATQRATIYEHEKEIVDINTQLKNQIEINKDLDSLVLKLNQQIAKLNTDAVEKTKELHGLKEQLAKKDKEISGLKESKTYLLTNL